MKRRWKLLTLLLCMALMLPCISVSAEEGTAATDTEREKTVFGVEEGSLQLNCKSVVLMEANTGTVLYVQNPDQALPPASVTKIMTLLLVMEALDAGTIRPENMVTVSANAASMGGSQVYLKEGEQMSVEDLLKSVVIASANDAAVALAEYLAGSVTAFVDKMNKRAEQLEMKNTHFENVTGLDDTAQNHLTSARDIAIMSGALIGHRTILQYSSIWMDTIRNGAFGLTNTNRLVRFYPGCTGLKTGSTSKAGFCVSVTAEREGIGLICVVMGADSRDERNAIATQVLDWGFANYGLYTATPPQLTPLAVKGGEKRETDLSSTAFSCVLPKGELKNVTWEIRVAEEVHAPIKTGDRVGEIIYLLGDKVIGSTDIVALEEVDRIGFWQILRDMLARFLLI